MKSTMIALLIPLALVLATASDTFLSSLLPAHVVIELHGDLHRVRDSSALQGEVAPYLLACTVTATNSGGPTGCVGVDVAAADGNGADDDEPGDENEKNGEGDEKPEQEGPDRVWGAPKLG